MKLWIFIALIAFILLLLGGFGVMLYITIPIARKVYFTQLVRTDKEKWGRVCSAPENKEQLAMWKTGLAWAAENKNAMRSVIIQNKGLTLHGEFYDFHSDTCVIILPGRCESLKYSYYFAPPYQKAGMNVLVIDTRCHGESDGKYASIGIHEASDLKAWIQYITTTFSIQKIWLHGICIGSAAALFTAQATDCPAAVHGIVLEGCFVNFRESFKQHMIAEKRPLFPVLDLVMLCILKYAKADVLRHTPLKAVHHVQQKILFLFGEQDIFSIPSKSKKLFEACASNHKKIVWFDKGGHSHLRINNTEKYDAEIIKFIQP